MTLGEQLTKMAVCAELIAHSPSPQADRDVILDELLKKAAETLEVTYDRACDAIANVIAIIRGAGYFDMKEFSDLIELCKFTQDVRIIDPSINKFVYFIRELNTVRIQR